MPVLKVRLLGDPVLREQASNITEITDELRVLAESMFDTMYAEEGVGLAAPQIGISQRLIVVDPHEDDVRPFALINPEIVEFGPQRERGEEGCLSIPGLKDVVERSYRCVVEGLTLEGEKRVIEAEGLLARILQHEIDHLNGVLFIDRVSPLKRKLLLAKWQKVKPTA